PISAVSAGQYIADLVVRLYVFFNPATVLPPAEELKSYKNWASVLMAIAVTLYFFRQNVRGIHESSDKALKIMIATTIMAVVLILWCGLTLVVQGRAPQDPADPAGPKNSVPLQPDFNPHMNPNTKEKEDPLGFLARDNILGWT